MFNTRKHPSRSGPLGTVPHLVYLSIPRWGGLTLGSRVFANFVNQCSSTQAGCLRTATHIIMLVFSMSVSCHTEY